MSINGILTMEEKAEILKKEFPVDADLQEIEARMMLIKLPKGIWKITEIPIQDVEDQTEFVSEMFSEIITKAIAKEYVKIVLMKE